METGKSKKSANKEAKSPRAKTQKSKTPKEKTLEYFLLINQELQNLQAPK